jgi:hypothetical protein
VTEFGEPTAAPGTRRTRRRPAPPAPTTGIVQVRVDQQALCWDTFGPDGTDSDRPLSGVMVMLSPATGAAQFQSTDDSGTVTFNNVPVGAANLRATKVGFVHDGSHGEATATVNVTGAAGPATVLTLRSANLVCTRKHVAKPAGTPGTNVLGPMFWSDEPWILLLRDVVWLLFMVLFVLFTALGLGLPGLSICLGLGMICFGIFAYATHVIFGMIAGVITMSLAFAGFLALVVFTFLSLLTTPPLPVMNGTTGTYGMPSPDIFFFPPLCGLWFAFGVGLAAGKQAFSHKDWMTTIAAMIVGIVVTIVVYLIVYYFADPVGFMANPGYVVGGAVAQLFAGAVTGFLGGFMGHVFINDGKIDEAQRWGLEDLILPYAGERYCVQGHHGFISHFYRQEPYTDRNGVARIWTTDEEFSYDWSMPEGEHILCAREGHIISFREDKTGNTMSSPPNSTANHVYVKHFDGTIAHYLHLKQGGVTRANPALAPAAVKGTFNDGSDMNSNPVHIWEGQWIGEAGNVGYSMFSHLHFQVHLASPDGSRNTRPVKFSDADVQIHGGRCFSMRKYRSDNVDRGTVQLGTDSTAGGGGP